MGQTIGSAKAKPVFFDLVNTADDRGVPLFITRHDEPRAVLIGYRTWESLMERMEDLEDTVSAYTRHDEPSRPIEDIIAELEQCQDIDSGGDEDEEEAAP